MEIRSFFAPNHTYDENTVSALKANNIINVIDGYGLMPFKKKKYKFFSSIVL